MKSTLFLVIFLSSFCVGNAQILNFQHSASLDADRFIGFDSYKNLYFIKKRVLYKKGKDGDFQFNTLNLGRISSVDILNPLKVVLFFEDTNTAVLLDNKLNEIQQIAFHQLPEFLNAESASTASNNSLWVFNSDSQQLELFNYKTKSKTAVSRPFPGKYVSQASNFNYCFILTKNKLRAYNIYGSFLNEIPLEGFEKIIQRNENVIALKDNQLYFFRDFAKHSSEISEEPFVLTFSEFEISVKDLQYSGDFLYIYDGQNLHTFTLTFSNDK